MSTEPRPQSLEEAEAQFAQHTQEVIERLQASGDLVAAALIKRLVRRVEHTTSWYGSRFDRLWHWAHAELDEAQKTRYFNIVANGTASADEPPTFAQSYNILKYRLEAAEAKLAKLRDKPQT